MDIKDNISAFTQKLRGGAKLIVVTKTQAPERILEAYHAGHRIFGENKVQELTQKYEVLPKDIQWHMIGHLQSNKVKYIAPFIALIHSVDSLKLLAEINKQAAKHNRIIPCLLQVHIATEETKFGFDVDELATAIRSSELTQMTNIRIVGLMGMATFTDDTAKIRAEFKALKHAFETLRSGPLPPNVEMKELSMGMSSDYEIAIEEGSTFIRIGTAIFGERTLRQ